MKLKITEQQLKFIIENEIYDDNNIMEINMDDYEGIHSDIDVKLIKILRDCKKNNCNRIKIIGDLDLSGFNNTNLLEAFCNKLYEVGGYLDLRYTPIESLPMLSKVGSYLNLYKTPIESLPMLSYVNGNFNLYETPIESLPMLSHVGGYLELFKSQIKSLPMLSYVEGELDLKNTQIKSLPMLSTVGGDLFLAYTPIESLPMLSEVGNDLFLNGTPLGNVLNKIMTKEEIKNKFGIKGELHI